MCVWVCVSLMYACIWLFIGMYTGVSLCPSACVSVAVYVCGRTVVRGGSRALTTIRMCPCLLPAARDRRFTARDREQPRALRTFGRPPDREIANEPRLHARGLGETPRSARRLIPHFFFSPAMWISEWVLFFLGDWCRRIFFSDGRSVASVFSEIFLQMLGFGRVGALRFESFESWRRWGLGLPGSKKNCLEKFWIIFFWWRLLSVIKQGWVGVISMVISWEVNNISTSRQDLMFPDDTGWHTYAI